MKYTLEIAFAGLYLLVPDPELRAVHVLFPSGEADPSRHAPEGPGHSDPAHVHDGAESHGMPQHDVLLAFEESRSLKTIALNGFDLNLSALNRETVVPELPPNVFELSDQRRGPLAFPPPLARAERPGGVFNGRVTLRGGMFDVYSESDFTIPGRQGVHKLAGTIIWKVELPGRDFPGAPLNSLLGGEAASIPPLQATGDIATRVIRFGIVHCPESIRVNTLEEILEPGVKFDADHMEMLYTLLPDADTPVIPVPAAGGPAAGPELRWPARCLGARTV
jgi:hypothetical protein